MATKNPDRTSRRQFVQAATTATVASAGMALPASAVETRPASRELSTDVLVCGAGCAGIAAALSAARNGAKVLLVEKAPFAGGIITSVGLPYFDGIADIRDKRIVVRGIALELLAKSGACRPDARKVSHHNPTIPNTFEFKQIIDIIT